MPAVVRCECGWEWRGESSDELVRAMLAYRAEAHPDLPAPPSSADVLAMAEEI